MADMKVNTGRPAPVSGVYADPRGREIPLAEGNTAPPTPEGKAVKYRLVRRTKR